MKKIILFTLLFSIYSCIAENDQLQFEESASSSSIVVDEYSSSSKEEVTSNGDCQLMPTIGNSPIYTTLNNQDCESWLWASASSSQIFDVDMNEDIANGALEFWFVAGNDWDENNNYFIIGNDGARILLTYHNKTISFSKNHSDIHKNVSIIYAVNPYDTLHIVGQWGNEGMKLFINGIIATNTDTSGYQPSPRTSEENILKVGQKNSCCMEGISMYDDLSSLGWIHNINLYTHPILNGQCEEFHLYNEVYFEDFSLIGNSSSPCGRTYNTSIQGSHILKDLVMPTTEGTIQIMYRQSADSELPVTIIGNDGARIQLIYTPSTIYFQKNLPDQHLFVSAEKTFKTGEWIKLKVNWGELGMNLFINDELVAHNNNTSSYTPSTRPLDDNAIAIEPKNSCCMEGIGIYTPTSINGDYDLISISNSQQ